MWKYNQTDELYHFGIPGMKWGHHKRRLDEYDRRYEEGVNKILNSTNNMGNASRQMGKLSKKLDKEYADSIAYKNKRDKTIKNIKTGVKILAGTAAVAAGAYAVKKYFDKRKQNTKISDIKKVDNVIKKTNETISKISNVPKPNLNGTNPSKYVKVKPITNATKSIVTDKNYTKIPLSSISKETASKIKAGKKITRSEFNDIIFDNAYREFFNIK